MRQMNLTPRSDPRGDLKEQLKVMIENLEAFSKLDRDTQRSLHFMYALSAKDALLTARQVLARLAMEGTPENSLAMDVAAWLPLFDEDTEPTNNRQTFDTMHCILNVLQRVFARC